MAPESVVEKLGGGLRALVANEDMKALDGAAEVLRSLGHEVVARAISVAGVADAIAEERPDVALVKLHGDDDHALGLIEELIEVGDCAVVALLDSGDADFVARAAKHGVTAYAHPVDRGSVRSALEIAVRRFAELSELSSAVEELEDAIGRRATIERAKGILMERHDISDRDAFEMLRGQARSSNRRVFDVAREVS